MTFHLLGLTGFAAVGKDTVADLLTVHFGFRKMAFADALRDEVCDGFGIDRVYLTSQSTKHTPMAALAMSRAPREFLAVLCLQLHDIPRDSQGQPTAEWMNALRSPRQILQWWGSEYRRAQHARYWSSIMVKRIVEHERMGETRLVITDCRFENEADTVRAAGGRLWQITRPGINSNTTAEGIHASVTDGSKFKPDAVINNSHDMRHLQQLVLGEFLALESGISGVKVTVPV